MNAHQNYDLFHDEAVSLEASTSRSPGRILPLEALWPTAARILEGYAEQLTRMGRRELRQQCLLTLQAKVLETPGLQAILDDIRAVTTETGTRLREAARQLRALAASDTPIPITGSRKGVSPVELRRRAYQINAVQKSGEGYCAALGCWEAGHGTRWCAGHDVTGRAVIPQRRWEGHIDEQMVGMPGHT
jgi:hypothetical protein